MSLPLLHAGRTNPGLSAALDLRFALDKSLTAYRGPTPSFSRASTGSYFDGSGVLRYKGYNLCLNSENFSAASWSKTNISASFSSTELSPNGDLTASLVVPNTANNVHHINPSTFNGAASSYTLSIYAKNSGYPVLILDANADVNFGATFNLATGTVTGTSGGSTATITSVGNGWYRCSITKESSFTFLIWRIYPNSSGVYSGDGSSGVLLWGAQVERTAILTDYSKTTSSANSAPRFDHTFNGTSWVSRGLLVEEQRTNLIQYSDISTDWNATNATKSSTSETSSPDGGNNAKKLVENLANSVHGVNASYLTISPTLTNGLTYTGSCFVKSGSRTKIMIVSGTGRLVITTKFDLNNSSVISSSATSNSITNVGNGWFRISATGSATSSGDSQFSIYILDDSGNETYTGNGSGSIYLWGFQVEQASFPTSYIGTTNSSVVRSADVCQITGADFSGFWNGTEGTVVAEFDVSSGYTSPDLTIANFYQSGSSWIGLRSIGSTSNNIFDCYSAGVQQARLGFSRSNPGISARLAAAFKANDFAASQNGSAVSTDTSGSLPSPTYLELGTFTGFGEYLNGHIARLRYFNKRLPNATLQQLSDPDPTLNLQFALNKSLTPVAGPAPSFSRASTGTYFNASGVLTSASINTPRFDHVYSGGQWVSRGLLIEEQRTNIVWPSNDLANANWTFYNIGSLTVTPNQAINIDGATSLAKIEVSNTTSQVHIIQNIFGSQSANTNYTAQCVVKYDGSQRYVGFRIYGGSIGYWVVAIYDLLNKSYAYQVGSGSGTFNSAGIDDIGGGYLRLWLSFKISAAGPDRQSFQFHNSLTPTLNPNDGTEAYSGTAGAYLYAGNFQFELGSFPTSYIGTTSSSVTRSADVCQITGTSFNWMWNQGEGSAAVEYDQIKPLNIGTVVNFNDGSVNNVMFDYASEGTSGGIDYGPSFYIRSGGTWMVQINNSPIVSGQQKYAVAFKTNDFAMSYAGGAVQTDSTVTLPTVNQLGIGKPLFAQYPFSGHIAKLIYYPARLTNAKLQQLST